MRHGFLSELQGAIQPGTTAGADASTQAPGRCPVGHYGSLYKDELTTPSSDELPVKDSIKGIADARSSGVDDLPDSDHGGVPAGYTYFGQLVAHDLTHRVLATLENLNTASLDLDTIYGGGPDRCPHLFQPPYLNVDWSRLDAGQHLFYLGRTGKAAYFENEHLPYGEARDVPRIDTGSNGAAATEPTVCMTPVLHDERNDDNLILSQLTMRLLLVHNAVADYLNRKGDPTRNDAPLDRRQSFTLARYFVIKAYRRVVVHDYLKQLLLESTHKDLIAGKIDNPGHLPIEFVFGAARVGHAMLRRGYTVNDHIAPAVSELGNLIAFSSNWDSSTKLPVPTDWVVNWSRFLPMEPGDAPQSARRISPFLAPALVYSNIATLHGSLDSTLSFLDLWRCYQFGVPTGQECAERQFGKTWSNVLRGDSMLPPLAFIKLHPADKLLAQLGKNPEFLDRTPLSYYLLQESALLGCNGRYLGPLGSRIYARTIMHALDETQQTYRVPAGRSPLTFAEIAKPAGVCTLPQFLKVAEMGERDLREAIVNTVQ
jgi:hypothetical protein